MDLNNDEIKLAILKYVKELGYDVTDVELFHNFDTDLNPIYGARLSVRTKDTME